MMKKKTATPKILIPASRSFYPQKPTKVKKTISLYPDPANNLAKGNKKFVAGRARHLSRNNLSDIQKLQYYISNLEKVNCDLLIFIREMKIVFRFIESVNNIYAQDRILEYLMQALQEICDFDAAMLYLATGEGEANVCLECKLTFHPGLFTRYKKKLVAEQRIYHWADRQRKVVILPDRFITQRKNRLHSWSFIIAPLLVGKELLGRIDLVFQRAPETFTQQTLSILNLLMKLAAMILFNERAYAKEKQNAQKYIELDHLKREVVNTTTHEIKTPLTVIQAASILLERNPQLPLLEQQKLLQRIIYQCNRISQIVSELFETAQAEDRQSLFQFQMVCLQTLTDEIINNLHCLPAQIQFQKDYCTRPCMIWADSSRIYKALRNLTENAIKYSITPGQIKIKIWNRGKRAYWEIKDQGIGIPPEDQEKIFDKFYRANNSNTRRVEGMGLGLYIAKLNVELNQGTIQLKQSKLGEGSTFRLEFPFGAKAGGGESSRRVLNQIKSQ